MKKIKSRYWFIFIFLSFTQTASPQLLKSWDFETNTNKFQEQKKLVKGVKGHAMRFNGVSTELNDTIPNKFSDFSIMAWIAPQEYSWNKSAVVNCPNKIFLGINDKGNVVGEIPVSGGIASCVSSKELPLLHWSHIAMVVRSNKEMQLFINGERVAEKRLSTPLSFPESLQVTIGKTIEQQVPIGTERKTSKEMKTYMFFDGLIDEIRLYKSPLSAESIKQDFKKNRITEIPLKFRKLPSGTDQPMPFGAYYTKLKYSEGWDAQWRGSDFPDVVVRFGKNNPTKLVFWRGTGYIPALVTENNLWMADQSVENWGTGECYEAMGDKQCRYSHVRIIENTPARVVIHWRYALGGIKHQIFLEDDHCPGDWVDEYWTAYPDGVVARNQILWSDFPARYKNTYQFQETIFFNPPGTKPEDNIHYRAITFMDMDGKTASYSWEKGAPKSFEKPQYKPVQWVNLKSVYKPYGIFDTRRVTLPFTFGWTEGYTRFPCWNHWPISQIASDGRVARTPDKVSHSSLTAVNTDKQIYERRPDGSIRVSSLVGLTKDKIKTLLPLAQSWNNPPVVESLNKGVKYLGYDKYQRCYQFTMTSNKGKVDFDLVPLQGSSIYAIPIEITNTSGTLTSVFINGKKLSPEQDFYTGQIQTLEGSKQLLWINYHSTKKCNVSIQFGKR